MKFQIEPTSDFEALARLNEYVQSMHHKLYPNEFKAFDLSGVTKAFEGMLSSPESRAFLAKKDTKPIGYLLCFIKTRAENEFQFAKTVLYLDQISVMEEFRNQGAATQLLEHAKKLAVDLKVDEVQLDHWDKNEDAKGFFNAQGFEYFNCKMKINI